MRRNNSTNPGRQAAIAAWRPVLIIAALVHATPGHAYLDPGTGSIILQSLLAGVAVAMGVLRLYWQRCKDFFTTLTGTASRKDANADGQEARDRNQTPD